MLLFFILLFLSQLLFLAEELLMIFQSLLCESQLFLQLGDGFFILLDFTFDLWDFRCWGINLWSLNWLSCYQCLICVHLAWFLSLFDFLGQRRCFFPRRLSTFAHELGVFWWRHQTCVHGNLLKLFRWNIVEINRTSSEGLQKVVFLGRWLCFRLFLLDSRSCRICGSLGRLVVSNGHNVKVAILNASVSCRMLLLSIVELDSLQIGRKQGNKSCLGAPSIIILFHYL